jgi:hypothetical protein
VPLLNIFSLVRRGKLVCCLLSRLFVGWKEWKIRRNVESRVELNVKRKGGGVERVSDEGERGVSGYYCGERKERASDRATWTEEGEEEEGVGCVGEEGVEEGVLCGVKEGKKSKGKVYG